MMDKTKKLICLAAAAAIMLSASACGGKAANTEETTDAAETQAAESTVSQTAEDTSEQTTAEAASAEKTDAAATVKTLPRKIGGEGNISGYSGMRNITAAQLAGDMKIGINVGNSLDSVGGEYDDDPSVAECCWGNPEITKALINQYKSSGFNAVRVPVTWNKHIGAAETYVINSKWMDRVEQVVKMVLDSGMYCILNTHHEQSWLNTSASDFTVTQAKFKAVWTQIAERFKNYDDHLVFEGFNEILKSEANWSTPSDEDLSRTNVLNQLFVFTVRDTGGNNKVRHLVVNTYGAKTDANVISAFKVPKDTVKNKIIVSVHSYCPSGFAFSDSWDNTSVWDGEELVDITLSSVYSTFIEKGYPVIIGEFGAEDKSNTADREKYAEYFVKTAKKYGITCFWWENGSGKFGLYDRYTASPKYSGIISALVNAS